MGAVMYAGPQLAASPYAHLLEPAHWSDVQDMFMRDACALMGLSIESPLGGSTGFCCIFSCHTEIIPRDPGWEKNQYKDPDPG
jgi:hypothetical protein